jgi:tripartite-type tricarboxylate transporter receptor subunit TctC
MRNAIRFVASALLLAAMTSAAHAQTYPVRPIRIIVGFSPGGAADVTARLLGEKYAATWGANAVVDNRTGASGIIATDIVAKANPDGYTLGLAALSFAVNPSIYQVPYDVVKDFTHITITSMNPLVLVVNNNLPVKSVREFIDLAKAKPDTLTFASSGTGTSPHLTAELFKLMTGVKLVHIPYKGSTAAHPDLIGGQVNLMFDTVAATVQLIKAGRLRALGVTSKSRSAELPDVPTIAESGVPGYESTSWGVLYGPARMPASVVEKIHKETIRALAMPDVKDRLARMGAEPIGNTPAEATRYIRSEMEKWSKTVKAAGIKSQ